MSDILFLCHRIPFPPDRGDKIRSHYILRRLAKIAPVHVATFADDDHDIDEEAELAAISASYALVHRAKPLPLAGLQALATRQPVSLAAFHDHALAAYVEDVLKRHHIACVYVFSGQMGQYLPAWYKGRVVADFVDVDSAKFDAYASKGRGPMAWVNAREGRLLRQEEARLAERADVSVLISRNEASLFRERLPEHLRANARIEVLGNGIHSSRFDPDMVAPETRMLDCPGPRLVFTGQMDYAPNIDAALRVAEQVMPLVRRHLPEATFHVVGRNPPADLLERDGIDGVTVWGRVDDIRPWLKAADLAVVALDIARGVQNKVLEAMAMMLPVVLTPGAAEGIDATDGEHFAIADTDEDLAAAIVDLLTHVRDAGRMGRAARRFVCDNVSWQAALDSLPALVGFPGRTVRDAA